MPVFNHELWSIVALTLRVTATALLIAAAIGVPTGVWLGLAKFPGKRALTALVYTGMALPPVVVGLHVYILLSRSGPLAYVEWLFTPKAMVLAQTVIALPLVAGLVMGAVAAVPIELVRQVRSLGRHHGRCDGLSSARCAVQCCSLFWLLLGESSARSARR
jgi:tungstate transport system permease protein